MFIRDILFLTCSYLILTFLIMIHVYKHPDKKYHVPPADLSTIELN